MVKSLQMETTMVQEVLSTFTNRSRKSPICVTCGTDKIKPEHFRCNKSRREFKISHMCQGCQDDVFSEE